MRIDHIGIAVKDLEEAKALYCEAFGLKVVHEEEVAAQQVKAAFLSDPKDPATATTVELLQPLGSEGAIAKFIAGKGPGMHHLAFHSSDIRAQMAQLRNQGRPPLAEEPRPGARGHSVCFVHPKNTGGVLVEVVS